MDILIYIYIIGCLVDGLLIGAHLLLGLLINSGTLRSNYRKIGVLIQLNGGISTGRNPVRIFIIDILFSWIAVALNIYSLLARIVGFFSAFRVPKEIADARYKLSNFELSAEEVLTLELSIRHSIVGKRFSEVEIIEMIQNLQNEKLQLDTSILINLLIQNDLIEIKSA